MAHEFDRVVNGNQPMWKCRTCGLDIISKGKPRGHYCRQVPGYGGVPQYSPFINHQSQFGQTPSGPPPPLNTRPTPTVSPSMSTPTSQRVHFDFNHRDQHQQDEHGVNQNSNPNPTVPQPNKFLAL